MATDDGLTEEERTLVKGLPPAIAEGFLKAHREKTGKRSYADIAEDLDKLQENLFKRHEERGKEFLGDVFRDVAKKKRGY